MYFCAQKFESAAIFPHSNALLEHVVHPRCPPLMHHVRQQRTFRTLSVSRNGAQRTALTYQVARSTLYVNTSTVCTPAVYTVSVSLQHCATTVYSESAHTVSSGHNRYTLRVNLVCHTNTCKTALLALLMHKYCASSVLHRNQQCSMQL